MKDMQRIGFFRQHAPAFLFLVQLLVALLFAIPAAERAAYSANQDQTVTVITSRSPRLGKIYFQKPTVAAAPQTLQRLSILVDTGGANINTVSLSLSVPPDAARLERLDLTSSFCTIITQNTLRAATGTAQLACGAPNPGLRTQIGTVAVLEYMPLRSGSVLFHLDQSASSLLTNDGFGSEALKSVEDLAVEVQGTGPTVPDFSTVHVPLISSTHALGSTCLRKEEASFEWLRPVNTDHFEYEFNTDPQQLTSPQATTDLEVTLLTQPGTTQYFHIRAVSASGARSLISTVAVSTCSGAATNDQAVSPPTGNPVVLFFQHVWEGVRSLWK